MPEDVIATVKSGNPAARQPEPVTIFADGTYCKGRDADGHAEKGVLKAMIGVRQHGIRADGHGDLDLLAARRLRVAEIVRAVLVDVPMHSRHLLVVFLQAVHADVALASRRILREDERQRDERPAILRPAREDWQLVEIRL